MFGPGDFVEVFQRAQKVNKSITMCKSRNHHDIYHYFIKLFVNLLSFRFLRIQSLHTSVADEVDGGRCSDTDCEPSNSDSSDEGTNPSSGGRETCQTTRMFTCPEQSCTKTFIRYSALERHCEFGAHVRSLERITLQDRAKISYAKNLHEGQTSKQQSLPVCGAPVTNRASDICQMGWALKSSPRKVRFTQEQKNFLDLKYNLGEQTGKKSSGEDVARQMRRARGQDGKRLFAVDDFLTAQQITSYFSRMAAKRKNVTEAEVDTEERENLIRDVTAEITERLVAEEEDQPVSEVESRGCCYSYRRVNLCPMNKDELRAKLTLSNLKSICLKYGIQGVSGNRKKEPYVNALFSFMEASPCNLHKGLSQY